tara:strand:- start:581 stop:949 length:369 start_codon:yes stop_codon:yes gene_type:complete
MEEVEEKCGGLKFKVINHNIWGKKRLAYNIDKHKYGSFIILHFETSEVNSLKEYDRFMILNNNILRNQTILLNEKPEISNIENLEEKSTTVDTSEDHNLTTDSEKSNDDTLEELPEKAGVKE